jgi:hypothetical protein
MSMTRRLGYCSILVAALGLFTACNTTSYRNVNIVSAGTFAPNGPPPEPPVRTDAGGGCIVDLTQTYTIDGSLSGAMKVDYRIWVTGPCGTPPGTFDEHWIAHGTFTGTKDGVAASARFSYLAEVKAGGSVKGHIVFSHGLDGELSVRGSFADGRLTYEGWVTQEGGRSGNSNQSGSPEAQ